MKTLKAFRSTDRTKPLSETGLIRHFNNRLAELLNKLKDENIRQEWTLNEIYKAWQFRS